MTAQEYVQKKGATDFVIDFEDDLNEGYTRRQTLVGAVLVKYFNVPNHKVRIDAYATASDRIVIIEHDDDGVSKARFYDCTSDFIEDDNEPLNLKSAIASELEIDYVEEVVL